MNQIKIKELTFIPLISKEDIRRRVSELAEELNEKLSKEQPIFVCILNGSFLFATDLFRQMKMEAEITFVKLASYSGISSTGKVLTLLGLDVELYDRTVVIIEDIIDTGKTMNQFLPELAKKGPKKVMITTLLTKPKALEYQLDIDQVGFEIDDQFVVGYGLDYDGLGRNFDAIYRLKDD